MKFKESGGAGGAFQKEGVYINMQYFSAVDTGIHEYTFSTNWNSFSTQPQRICIKHNVLQKFKIRRNWWLNPVKKKI